jgi:hypothetical protein
MCYPGVMNDEMKDIVDRLRSTAETALPSTTGFTRLSDNAARVLAEAADEIERLRQKLAADEPAARVRNNSSTSSTRGD